MIAPANPQLARLAHALELAPEQLEMVAGLAEGDLRQLRTLVTEALFQADKHHFARVAALARAVPGAVAAKLTELVLPPLLAARTAELLDPKRAADLVGRISPGYLADVSAVIDPSRAPEVVAAMPAQRVGAVAAELARRGEWIVIGSFVDAVTGDGLAASVAVLDGEQLLRIGYVLDEPSRLDDIGGLLTDEQVDQLLAAAVAGLWTEFALVLAHQAPARLDRLAGRFASADPSVVAGFEAAAARGDLDAAALAALRRQ